MGIPGKNRKKCKREKPQQKWRVRLLGSLVNGTQLRNSAEDTSRKSPKLKRKWGEGGERGRPNDQS
jgi:hypothetical protein